MHHQPVKRSILPADFQEEINFKVLETLEQTAAEPKVLMQVLQNDETINGSVTVIPGTPLIMEIKLNEVANTIYGLKIIKLEVTDKAEMSETILFRGCTVFPYLFENFHLTSSNSLAAKFRAFKFPKTASVQFRANVQICLEKCQSAQCSAAKAAAAHQLRTRRELTAEKSVYEAHSTVVLKFKEDYKSNAVELQSLQNHMYLLHIKNLQQLHSLK